MEVLVINSGSSSLKLTLFKKAGKLLKKADILVDRIGIDSKNHTEALTKSLDLLKKKKIIKDIKQISVIGHRVVHGGEKYKEPTKITSQVIKDIKSFSKLAPLHNPANLEGILACKKILQNIPQVAVFDTAYHQTIPKKAYIYGLPYNFYSKHHIRKYGFHGTSHKYVVNEAIKMMKKKNARIVSCHIGNGTSITASLNGKSIDTSMGFTPLEGVIMGTRSGSIDPAIIFYLADTLKMPIKKIQHTLEYESGLKGISQISSDMRDIYGKSLKEDSRAIFTIDILSYQIAKYIGSYTSILGGIDAIIFTGGIGENAFYIREKSCNYLSHLGMKIDKKKNKKNKILISDKKSKVKVFVIHTDEALQIAEESIKLIKK
jgi:acetate kinase